MDERRPDDRAMRPVFEAFAEHEHRLRALLDADDEVVDLCADFDAVARAYRQALAGESGLANAADEYHTLRLELEGEILARLHEVGVSGE